MMGTREVVRTDPALVARLVSNTRLTPGGRPAAGAARQQSGRPVIPRRDPACRAQPRASAQGLPAAAWPAPAGVPSGLPVRNFSINAAGLGSAWAFTASESAQSSTREAPEISKDPVADSTDLYAFVSPDDPDTVTLIANYVPLENPAGGPVPRVRR